MSKGYSGLFSGTSGASVNSSYLTDSSDVESYSERGIDIPEHIKEYLSKLQHKGDYITGSVDDFSMTDVSVMSKETGVEFAHVTVGSTTYLIRGDVKGTVIPYNLLNQMEKKGGTWDYHSHPHNDDLVPSQTDMELLGILGRTTGQRESTIVTPNGMTSTFSKDGVISTGTVSNSINEDSRKALLELFGGQ